MILKKLASALVLAGVTAFSGGAFAVPTISNQDGPVSPFGGFDWASGSVAWTTGFTGVTGSSFTLTYAGWAANILSTTGGVITPSFSSLDTNADGSWTTVPGFFGKNAYEYTIWATITETIIGCDATSCTFSVTGGSFDIYYDVSPTAAGGAGTSVQTNGGTGAWTGFQDGTKIISGSFNATASSQVFNTNGANGSNSTTLDGSVSFTNSAYVNPALTGTKVTSTLQLGSAKTAVVSPTSIDGVTPGSTQIVFQADANQSLFNVPEPSAIALAGLALLAGGMASRRRKA